MPHPLRSSRTLTITQLVESPRDAFARGRRVPMIRMRGDWLEENGFVTGARVDVTVESGRIVLTLAGEV